MRAPQMRRGFDNACLNVAPRKAGLEFSGGHWFAPDDHLRTILETPAIPNSVDGFRDMRRATLHAHFRKFILTAKYKAFCYAIIRGLQFGGRRRELRQRRLMIKNPARVIIKRVRGEVRDQPKRSCLLSSVRNSFCGRFGRLRRSIRREPAPKRADRPGMVLSQRKLCSNGTNRKQRYGTKACEVISFKPACYLCNTHPKTGGLPPFEAVPLLRVQKCSVIVMLRRRGASRGRPVRWFA